VGSAAFSSSHCKLRLVGFVFEQITRQYAAAPLPRDTSSFASRGLRAWWTQSAPGADRPCETSSSTFISPRQMRAGRPCRPVRISVRVCDESAQGVPAEAMVPSTSTSPEWDDRLLAIFRVCRQLARALNCLQTYIDRGRFHLRNPAAGTIITGKHDDTRPAIHFIIFVLSLNLLQAAAQYRGKAALRRSSAEFAQAGGTAFDLLLGYLEMDCAAVPTTVPTMCVDVYALAPHKSSLDTFDGDRPSSLTPPFRGVHFVSRPRSFHVAPVHRRVSFRRNLLSFLRAFWPLAVAVVLGGAGHPQRREITLMFSL